MDIITFKTTTTKVKTTVSIESPTTNPSKGLTTDPVNVSMGANVSRKQVPFVKADSHANSHAVDSWMTLSETQLICIVLAVTVVVVLALFAVMMVVAWWLKKGTSKYSRFPL